MRQVGNGCAQGWTHFGAIPREGRPGMMPSLEDGIMDETGELPCCGDGFPIGS
jgi:hypothetical protein